MSPARESAETDLPYIESDAEFDGKAGETPARWDDARRFPRFICHARVEVTIHPPPEAANQPPVHCAMMTRDLSRGGINLLHSDQLYPGQRIDVLLNGAMRPVEVLWCRRLANRCYSAGCRFIAAAGVGAVSSDL